MKVLVATEKPFAKVAIDGIRKEVEAAGYELALLEKYTEKQALLEFFNASAFITLIFSEKYLIGLPLFYIACFNKQ